MVYNLKATQQAMELSKLNLSIEYQMSLVRKAIKVTDSSENVQVEAQVSHDYVVMSAAKPFVDKSNKWYNRVSCNTLIKQ